MGSSSCQLLWPQRGRRSLLLLLLRPCSALWAAEAAGEPWDSPGPGWLAKCRGTWSSSEDGPFHTAGQSQRGPLKPAVLCEAKTLRPSSHRVTTFVASCFSMTSGAQATSFPMAFFPFGLLGRVPEVCSWSATSVALGLSKAEHHGRRAWWGAGLGGSSFLNILERFCLVEKLQS